jgi:hypothetical protein
LDFVSGLVIFENLLSITKGLSDQLQAQDLDLVGALSLLDTAVDQLVEAHESGWQSMWHDILELTQQNSIRMQVPGSSRRGRARQQKEITDCIPMETTGQRLSDIPADSTDEDYFRRNMFLPAVDKILQELNSRFSDEGQTIMSSIQACSPQSSLFLDAEKLSPVVAHYGLSCEELLYETQQAKKYLKGGKPEMESIGDVADRLWPVKAAFPVLFKTLQIALTIGVTSSSCERTFSCLKLLKTYTRQSMSQTQLNSLAIVVMY